MLDPAFFDRFAMGFSLSIHIILAVIGVTLPVIILVAEFLGIRYKDPHYRVLARRLSLAFLVLFAVGTASGTLVAANLFFLWPSFMALVSKVAIGPVYAEVFAFFTESIFLAIYLYSERIFRNRYSHVCIMVLIALGGVSSAAFITILNAFMNTPVGFNIPTYLSNSTVTGINPVAVFTSPSAGIEVAHVVSTSYFAGSMIFLAYFAYMFLKARSKDQKSYYQKALKLIFALAVISTFFAAITGILSIESLYATQPEKYAAIELNLNSTAYAPEIIGGVLVSNTVKYALDIPNLQSMLATGSASGVVPGLNQFPKSTWPPLIIHDMFDFMVLGAVLIGVLLILVFLLYVLRKKVFESRNVAKLFIALGVLGVILLENGWLVDEFGRQPWIIYNVMTVQQAANQSPSIIPIAILIVVAYIIMLPLTLIVLRRIFSKRSLAKELKEQAS